jgi:hypothetical protein
MKIQALIAAVAVTLCGAAFAQVPAPAPKDPLATPRIDQRQINQQKRIDQGVASGQLTPKETARLEKRESKIAADKTLAKSDGKVTRAERRRLRREENRASKAIYKQKHDRQTVSAAKK